MDFEKKVPEWTAEGTEPPASLRAKGFETGYKPPATFFNWFWSNVSACLKELQEKMKAVREVADGGTGRKNVTSGSYLVGNGTGAMGEKTPDQVREHIGAAKKNAAIPVVAASSADGISYTATVDGVTELYNGLILTIIPDVVSASTAITLNVNNLGPKMVRLPLSFNNAAMTTPKLATYFTEGRPITLQYDAEYLAGDGIWKTLGKQRTSAQDLYGTVPIEGGGTDATTVEEAREKLGVPSIAEMQRRDRVVNLPDNSYFPEAINQRKVTTTTAWGYCLDRWIARLTGIGLATDANGLHITSDATANVFLYQKIKIQRAQMLGKAYTVAICDGDGNIACQSVTLPAAEPTAWETFAIAYAGNVYAAIINTGSDEHGICVSVGRRNNSTAEGIIRWVALYEGSYTADTLPSYQPKGYGVEMVECQRYYHLYATSAARPAHGLDCSPPMRLAAPTQGTVSINNVTYYYNAADL